LIFELDFTWKDALTTQKIPDSKRLAGADAWVRRWSARNDRLDDKADGSPGRSTTSWFIRKSIPSILSCRDGRVNHFPRPQQPLRPRIARKPACRFALE